MSSRHLSIRITESSFNELKSRSVRRKETVSDTARQLIEEGLRMQAHPGIVFRESVHGRLASLANAEFVWMAIAAFPKWDEEWDVRSTELVGGSALTASQIWTAQKYYAEYPEEIDERIRANEEAAEQGYAEWLRRQPVHAK